MRPTILFDLRAFQTPGYRVRGIGHHLSCLLRTRRQFLDDKCSLVGLLDPSLPEVDEECASWFDRLSHVANQNFGRGSVLYVDGSPMTHETRFAYRFQGKSDVLRVGVVYDFIPLDWPGYLLRHEDRISYFARLARLRSFDHFFPISHYTASRLSQLLAVPKSQMSVTGAPVRAVLQELNSRLTPPPESSIYANPYFALATAGDPRKNSEVAVKAVARLNLLHGNKVRLEIAGHYNEEHRRKLFRLAGSDAKDFLRFHPDMSDEKLATLYAGAVAVIAPSHIEGFSLPVIEGPLFGCPVVASTCAAHMELVSQPEVLFPSDDPIALSERLESLLTEPALRQSLVTQQRRITERFSEVEVGKRFWRGVGDLLSERRTVYLPRNRKRSFAFLSPYPPDVSDSAVYTAHMLNASKEFFSADLYTNAARPFTFLNGARDAGPISIAPIVKGSYNAVISVLGKSHFEHQQIFEIFERYGGPCILHDVPLTGFYLNRFGPETFLRFAGQLLGRAVSLDEANGWLQTRTSPSLFLEHVIRLASPLIVNTQGHASQIRERYGVSAHVALPCPTRFFADWELSTLAREQSRKALGLGPGVFNIISSEPIDQGEPFDISIFAVELLRGWNIPVELHFVGPTTERAKAKIDALAARIGVSEFVNSYLEPLPEREHRQYLIAAEAAVQLRTHGSGQLSTALTDCISAGLPSVSNWDLAQSCDAPDFVLPVPDMFSHLQVAERLGEIWDSKFRGEQQTQQRLSYVETHNFRAYAKRLAEILELA